jgi:hypothetical protein
MLDIRHAAGREIVEDQYPSHVGEQPFRRDATHETAPPVMSTFIRLPRHVW